MSIEASRTDSEGANVPDRGRPDADRITFRLNREMYDRVERAVEDGAYPNQSDLVRAAVARELERIDRGEPDGD